LQQPHGDGLDATSDGVFVYAPDAIDVAVGDWVEATGIVAEAFGQTQIARVSRLRIVTSDSETDDELAIEPVQLTLALQRRDLWERYEGMLVVVDRPLAVTEIRNLATFGEIFLAADGRLFQPTQLAAPGPEARRLAAAN